MSQPPFAITHAHIAMVDPVSGCEVTQIFPLGGMTAEAFNVLCFDLGQQIGMPKLEEIDAMQTSVLPSIQQIGKMMFAFYPAVLNTTLPNGNLNPFRRSEAMLLFKVRNIQMT